jgi:hypothetical protein
MRTVSKFQDLINLKTLRTVFNSPVLSTHKSLGMTSTFPMYLNLLTGVQAEEQS